MKNECFRGRRAVEMITKETITETVCHTLLRKVVSILGFRSNAGMRKRRAGEYQNTRNLPVRGEERNRADH